MGAIDAVLAFGLAALAFILIALGERASPPGCARLPARGRLHRRADQPR